MKLPVESSEHRGPTGLESVRAVAFDLDGTVYLQGTPLPGALELLDSLSRAGVDYLLVTNNSSASGAMYLHKLEGLGIRPTRNQVLTSNDVAMSYLLRKGIRRPFLLATEEVRSEYRSVGLVHEIQEPDAVLLTFDIELTFNKLSVATRHIIAGVPFLATHPDVTCPVPGGILPDTGAFIEMFAAATGRRPKVLGKPHPDMISEIRRRLPLPADQIAFVGDRLETDIQMATDAGFVGVLTLTGVTKRADLTGPGAKPDVVVDDMIHLRTLLRRIELLA